MIRTIFCLFLAVASLSWASPLLAQPTTGSQVIVLGVAQDGGFPHIGCQRKCCKGAWQNASSMRFVASIAVVNPAAKQWWLVEATPDIKEQVELFAELTDHTYPVLPEGILVTHAHIGHYTGLAQLGREAMSTKNLRVYAMPRMHKFLTENGPWSQLVSLHNISLQPLTNATSTQLDSTISVTPFVVPHRDEYSETVGFEIHTPNKTYVFLPDVDKWLESTTEIQQRILRADIAFIDATFFTMDELPNRKITEVPHPLVTESIAQFSTQPLFKKGTINFIHFNHTNPLLWDMETGSGVREKGFDLAEQGKWY